MESGAGERGSGSARDDERALHARLLQRDPIAPSDLAVEYLAPLVAWLRRAFPRVRDDALLEDVADTLILDLAEHPERYDPGRGSLTTYLHIAARADVLNALEREGRRHRHQLPLDDVELRAPARNRSWRRSDDPAAALDDSLGAARVARLREQFQGRERAAVDLIIAGERRTEPFARVLGLDDRPKEEQVRDVKRVKDRLKKRMQRLWLRMTDDG